MIRIYGGDPATSAPARFEDSMGDLDGDFFVHTVSVTDRVVAMENNGWTGNAEIARRASARGGRFGSVYWCEAIATLGVIYAVDGVVQGWHHDRSCGQGKAPAGMPEWDEALAAPGHPVPAAAALLAQLMTLDIRQEWFLADGRTTAVPDSDTLLPQVELGEYGTGEDIIQSDPACWAP